MITKTNPIPTKIVLSVLTVILVVLALAAGYYQAALKAEIKKYNRLEDKYVRVRNMLGRDETQRLIDLSYESEASASTGE